MQLVVSQVQNHGFVEVATHHNGQTILWPAKAYSKVKLNHPDKVFDELNEFLKWIPVEAQDVIWHSYVQIKDLLDLITDNIHIGNTIRYYVTEMYKVVPMDMWHKWLLTQGNLFIPPDIIETISEDSRHSETDITYLKAAYIYLATEGLAMRLMVPIWGEFIDQASDNDHKELEAVGLIDNTELKHWPEAEPVWEKLLKYVRFFSNDPSAMLNQIWRGFGLEEIPDHLLAKAVVRRLTIIPLNTTAQHSLIANIYRYVRGNTKPQDRTTQDRVNKKRPDESSGGEDDDKISIAESYKLKKRVSDGEEELFDIDTRNMLGLCKMVDPTIPDELVVTCTHIDTLNAMALIGDLHPHQIRLAQWVMAKAFRPRAYGLIEDMSVFRLLGCTQALLWHWGYLDIAVLMMVELVQQTDQLNMTLNKQGKSGARIAGKYKEELALYFPFVKPQRSKPNDPDPESNFQNKAAIAINNLTADIRNSNWRYRGPKKLLALSGAPEGINMVIVPQAIKNTITELVIHMAKISQ